MAAGFKTATVNASLVPATQTNFPAYVDLSRLGITTQAEADSVRVYADQAKTTEWAREIVCVTEMHVKIPSLTTTTSIYVEWDGVSADYAVTDTYGRNAVWSDYSTVMHMQGNYNSSTGSNGGTAETGTTYGTSFAAFGGSAAQGVDLRGNSGDEIQTALTFSDSTPNTTQAWAKYDGTPPSNNRNIWTYWNSSISPSTARQFCGTIEHLSVMRMRFGDDSGFISTAFNGDTWYNIHGTIAADGTKYLYKNGSQIFSKTTSLTAPKYTAFYIGSQKTANENWNGKVDEVRVRNSVLSANWITTEYNNQNDEAAFWGTWTNVALNTTNFFYMT
jgi:hypothetical protein